MLPLPPLSPSGNCANDNQQTISKKNSVSSLNSRYFDIQCNECYFLYLYFTPRLYMMNDWMSVYSSIILLMGLLWP